MTVALVATMAMSAGSVARALDLHPAFSSVAFLIAVAALAAHAFRPPGAPLEAGIADRAGRSLIAVAVVAVVAERHLLVASRAVAPDDVLALVVVAAMVLPGGSRWRAVGAGLAVAAYVTSALTLIAASPYRSDAVVATHGGAELLLAGRHPYADFDMIERLSRFGLPPEFATPLEDGTRLRSLNYPALAIVSPAPFVAAGLSDVRVLYLAEVLAIFALVSLSVAPRARAVALALCIGNLVILGQFVLAGVDPLWALLVLAAWRARRRTISAVLIGLALADRQLAWLIAPFLIAWAWRDLGRREALARAAIAGAVALLVHVPFLVTAPAAVIGGITDVVLLPLEARGVGPAGAGLAAVIPRGVFLAAAAITYVAALWAFATARARGRTAPLLLPLLPVWLAWRALPSYFALLPVMALLEDGAAPAAAPAAKGGGAADRREEEGGARSATAGRT